MSEQKEFKIEITQDKLVDILMHAATRDDIAKLDSKLEAELAKKATREDAADLANKIDKLESKIDKLTDKYDKITWFISAAILVPIALHFLK